MHVNGLAVALLCRMKMHLLTAISLKVATFLSLFKSTQPLKLFPEFCKLIRNLGVPRKCQELHLVIVIYIIHREVQCI